MFEFGKGYINISTHMFSIEVKTKVISLLFVFFSKIMVLKFYVFELNMKT
jgi:hypothetical protein